MKLQAATPPVVGVSGASGLTAEAVDATTVYVAGTRKACTPMKSAQGSWQLASRGSAKLAVTMSGPSASRDIHQ